MPRRSLWKCVAIVPLLGLTLWWIHSDTPASGVSAAPLNGNGIGAPGEQGGGAGAAARSFRGTGSGFGIGASPGIDPRVGFDSASFGDPGWRHAALWDDSKAEFCAYEASWAHYGRLYKGRALLVLVKEPWNPELDVKADVPARHGFEMLKLNHLRDVATGIYTYHQMASVFWRRDTGALQKIAATSEEACGVSFAEMRRGKLQTHSYFDGQGDRTQTYPAGAVPEDGLPAALRDFVAGSAPAFLAVFPSLLNARFADFAPQIYSLERRTVPAGLAGVPAAAEGAAGLAAVPGAAGAARDPIPTVEIRLSKEPFQLTYAFERQPPHRLLRFERQDGTVYRMVKCERLAYWQMNEPGAEAWLPPAVR
ncbi:MAG TPA: hypothetical protein VHR45_19380 [Thermoanaerobaculia bacterium]|nr:hypothetical protein [Thermoanaerobaculia bacterium]